MRRSTQMGIRRHIEATRANVERVVLKRDGSAHALGVMPNTSKRGWYFAGWQQDILAEIRASFASA